MLFDSKWILEWSYLEVLKIVIYNISNCISFALINRNAFSRFLLLTMLTASIYLRYVVQLWIDIELLLIGNFKNLK